MWCAFFCEVTYKQWCKLDAALSDHALRKAVAACRCRPGKEQSLPKGSTDARFVMLGSGTNSAACGSPWRTGSLYQSDGYCSLNAFLLGAASLAPAQSNALIAGSTSLMLNGEFVKLVNEATGLHLTHYAEQLDTMSYVEFNCAILMHSGQYMASPIMQDGAVSHQIFIDVDRQVVHDPAHQSSEVGSGIPMNNCGWMKQLGNWETWHVCDVQEVATNDYLHDMVACYVCNSTFQPAKEVPYCRNDQAKHENGKCHRAASWALQIK